jgi:hypothetical protein
MVLNELHKDLYEFTCEYAFPSVLIIIGSIGFTIYGWLCISNTVPDSIGFCNDSFTAAVIIDLIWLIFLIIPYSIGSIINCIYPVKTIKKPTVLEPSHSRLSYNEVYRLQNYSPTSPQISRISPLKVTRKSLK